MASTEKKGSRKERREEERADRLEARRQLALGQIRRYPDPVLRERAHEVEEFSDDLRALVGRMGRVMEDGPRRRSRGHPARSAAPHPRLPRGRGGRARRAGQTP